jgi:20S proteasome alpha/beta subunit
VGLQSITELVSFLSVRAGTSRLLQNGGSAIAMQGRNCVAIACDLRLGNQALTLACNFEKVTHAFLLYVTLTPSRSLK